MASAYQQSGSGSSSGGSSSGGSTSEGSGGAAGGSTGGRVFGGLPRKAAEAFLAAVQTKDPDQLAETVALRSVSEMEGATLKHQQKYFKPILEKSVESDTLDELAAMFNGMKVVGENDPRTTGTLGVILGKAGEGESKDGKYVTITLKMRKEKAGWKVLDFSQPRVADHNPFAAPKMPTGRGAPRRR